ncbi:ATP-binding protein [Streptomyces marokkonensis]|uniref:ATP-binding protein n=1 Tax=Streptomyces marokkonensis TaxID=324855 RepID=A0ABW6QF89_9ACTN
MPHTQVSFAVEATAVAVHSARHRVSAAVKSLGGPSDGELYFRLELVASELLTNGLLHAGGPMTVEVTVGHGLIVIAVLDSSSVVPRRQLTEIDNEGGRGLALIQALCLFQGTERTAFGKRCWAVVPTATTPGPAVAPVRGHAPEEERRGAHRARIALPNRERAGVRPVPGNVMR